MFDLVPEIQVHQVHQIHQVQFRYIAKYSKKCPKMIQIKYLKVRYIRYYCMILQTIITLPFPYLVISTLWSLILLVKNTFLWTRELYWMGHRTLNEPFEWSVVHPSTYCVIITYCLLAHLFLSPTPIVITNTYCFHLLFYCYGHLLPPATRQTGGLAVPLFPSTCCIIWYLLVATGTCCDVTMTSWLNVMSTHCEFYYSQV